MGSEKGPVVLWFRRDLRLADNAAVSHAEAMAGDSGVVALFVHDPALWAPAGAPRRAFLAGCLDALDESTGGRLLVSAGRPEDEVVRVARHHGASVVVATEDFGRYGRQRDAATEQALARHGIALELVDSPYAVAPGRIVKADGTPYQVFTAFWRAWLATGWDRPVPAPTRIRWLRDLESQPGALRGHRERHVTWPPGERAGLARLEDFVAGGLRQYEQARDRPGVDGTSRLSPYLKFGCLHPRTVLARLGPSRSADAVRRELCWRDFYADVLHHRPDSARRSLLPAMAGMEVDTGHQARERFAAWCEGRTGYPIVDAGMRQLRGEAWMHNRVRMVTASFLVKDLHIDWRWGARWFMRLLCDGDLASNQHGWQWVAGTGTDAAPYFRIFNPVTQSRRFDPEGDYIRRWVPELADLGARDIHEPWRARQKGVQVAYVDRIVDHATERAEALRRFRAIDAHAVGS